jgi:hypothetical protein
MAAFSSLRETRSRLEKMIADVTEPRWRVGLEDFLQHWWGEVIGDLVPLENSQRVWVA